MPATATPKTALLIIYPTISHYVSFLGLAAHYKSLGYIVWIGGPLSQEKLIIDHGYLFVQLSYFKSYEVNGGKLALAIFVKHFQKTFVQKRYRDFLSFCLFNTARISKINPDIVLLDADLSIYYILLRDKYMTTIINTKLSVSPSGGIPPLSSNQYFSSEKMYHIFARFAWYKVYLFNLVRQFIRLIIFHGYDECYFIDRYLSHYYFKFHDFFLPQYRCALFTELDINKTKLDILILPPPAIEYRWKKLHPCEKYFRPTIALKETSTPEWPHLVQFIGYRSMGETTTIYCAFGTITARFVKKLKKFITLIIECFNNIPQFRLMISTGGMNPAQFKHGSNIYVAKYLPQTYALRCSDLAIIHGGMNSIAECLELKIPMLVYPLNTRIDQMGNSARVQFNGFGLMGNMKKETKEKLLIKVSRILLKQGADKCNHEQNITI